MKSNKEPKRKVGEILRDLRLERRWTQEDVAKMLSCAKSTISAYERDESSPNADIIIAYCDLFNVSADRILGRAQVDNMMTMEQIMEKINSLDINECKAWLEPFFQQFYFLLMRCVELAQRDKKLRVRKENQRKAESK